MLIPSDVVPPFRDDLAPLEGRVRATQTSRVSIRGERRMAKDVILFGNDDRQATGAHGFEQGDQLSCVRLPDAAS